MALSFSAKYRLAAQLLGNGIVGEITNVESHRSHRGPTHASWFYRKEIAGGGVLLDLGIYELGAVAALFGPARNMSSLCTTHFTERTMDDGSIIKPDVEDSALVNLQMKNNIAVSINANWNGFLSHHDTRSRMMVIGREGVLYLGAPGGGIYVHRLDGVYDKLQQDAEEVMFDGFPCLKVTAEKGVSNPSVMRDFAARIEAGDTSLLPLKRQLHVIEIILEVYRSHAANEIRTLKTTF